MSESLPTKASSEPDRLRPDKFCDDLPALFSLGNIVATPAALRLIEQHGASIPQLLNGHQTGDWHELCKEDRDANWRAAFGGERVLSTYDIGGVNHPATVWIITEWDRSVTTILRPQDY